MRHHRGLRVSHTLDKIGVVDAVNKETTSPIFFTRIAVVAIGALLFWYPAYRRKLCICRISLIVIGRNTIGDYKPHINL